MGKIDDLIKELCPDGVEWKTIEETCDILDSQRKPISKSKRKSGTFPYYGANGIQDWVDGYIFDGTYILMGEDGSVINKDNTPVLNWVSGKIWVNNHAHILKEGNNQVDLRFIYYILQTVDVSGIVRGVPPKINQANLKGITIPLPPLSIQQQIVEILDTFTDSISNLQEELELREKQMEFYRENLLSFDGEDVEWKSIKDCISSLTTGVNPRQHFVLNSEDSSYHYITGKNINDNKIDVSSGTDKINAKALSLINKRAKLTDDILLFASTGTGTVGRMAYVKQYDNSWTVSETLYIIRTQRLINTKFLMYVLNTWRSKKQYIGRISKGSVPHLKISDLLNVFIPVPSLSRQQEIVDILDTFESMITNIKEEIELRQKQYEYYREKLLTFERKGV